MVAIIRILKFFGLVLCALITLVNVILLKLPPHKGNVSEVLEKIGSYYNVK